MAVAAVFKEQASEFEHRHEMLIRRILLGKDRIENVKQLHPVQQIGLFIGPRRVLVQDMLQPFVQLVWTAAQARKLLLHLHQPFRLHVNPRAFQHVQELSAHTRRRTKYEKRVIGRAWQQEPGKRFVRDWSDWQEVVRAG